MLGRSIRVQTAMVAVGLVAALVCVSGGTAGASPRHGNDRGRRHHHQPAGGYLALGDSVPFGYSPLLEDPWLPDRFVGYPELIARRTGWATTNLACPGQTAQALVSRDAPDNGCFEFRAFADEEGIDVLHAEYAGTQLDAALDAVRSDTPPSLISVQAGGNDLTMCFDDPGPTGDPDACLDDTLPRVADSLRALVTQLHDAGYRGRIVFVGFHLVPELAPQLRRLNRTIERTARHLDVAFADTARPFARYARHHGGDLCSSGLLVALPDGSCDLHPTAIGHGLIADAVLEAASDHGHGHGHGHSHTRSGCTSIVSDASRSSGGVRGSRNTMTPR